MPIFSNLFDKSESGQPEEDSAAQEIIEYLGCEYEMIDPGISTDEVMSIYLDACKKGKTEGFTPVIIVADDCITEMLEENAEDNGGKENYRWELLSGDHSEGEALLRNDFEQIISFYKNNGFNENMLYGEYSGNANMRDGFYISYNYSYSKENKEALILAKIPTDKPWEVFAWIPFGSWNDCPDAEDMMSVCRYWYDEYGALPAVISHDTLEMYLSVPVTSPDTALKIAEEQYGFCRDIVDQGTETLKVLAESIVDSKIWFFWWD